ncbi:unnamed protein product, partial [marine sediment metagenome]
FEITFNLEIKDLYTRLNGNVLIFRQGLRLEELNKMINNELHLQYTVPYKIISLKGKKLTPDSKKIYLLAKNLSHKKKDHFLLKDLLSKTTSSSDFNDFDSIDAIYELVHNNILIPVNVDDSRKKILTH